LPACCRENFQLQIFLRTEDKLSAVYRPGAGGQIDLKGADSDDGIVRRRGADAGLQRRARQRNQLADTEWFDDVDSRAEFEQPEFLFGWRKQRRETQIRRTPKGIS